MDPDRFSGLPEQEKARLAPAGFPKWVDPMLATLTRRAFSDPGWIFERKLDGIRCLAFRQSDTVRLLSRNRLDLTSTYPEVTDAVAAQADDQFVIDGEVVAFEGARTSFSLLQQRSGISDRRRALQSRVKVSYYVFDLLHLDGFDLRSLSLLTRKALLDSSIQFSEPLVFTEHEKGEGEAIFESACAKGWEGVIAKRADSAYSSRRSTNWLKVKCVGGQEFVVAGFTDPSGSRTAFGALLLGYYDGDDLVYAGKVGTGFRERTLRELRGRLKELEVESSPFSRWRKFDRGTHFVQPVLVAQVGFTEWTRD